MQDYGIFQEDRIVLICGSKEKAQEMSQNYRGSEVHPVEYVNREWVKKT